MTSQSGSELLRFSELCPGSLGKFIDGNVGKGGKYAENE
jgi:hypothetical protein